MASIAAVGLPIVGAPVLVRGRGRSWDVSSLACRVLRLRQYSYGYKPANRLGDGVGETLVASRRLWRLGHLERQRDRAGGGVD
eukprot:1101674-Prymnesium_polylepis.1